MDRKIFEGRYLVNLTGSVIRQDALHPIGRLNWEKMFRTADYHRIANITYLGMLGNTSRVPERWKERFFERYQEALRFGETCMGAEQEILSLLDMKRIVCTILTSCGIRSLYPIPEAAGNSPLRLYLGEENYTLAKGQLVDLGYETDRFYGSYGERMRRVNGFCVELYRKLPFRTKAYERLMYGLMDRAYVRDTYHCVRTLALEERFVYRLASASYQYVQDELLIRELLDLYLYHKNWGGQMNWEYIWKYLKELNVDELSRKLLRIACMWFGTKEDMGFMEVPDDMSVYDVIENRILSRGEWNQETDMQAICLARLIQRAEEAELKKKRAEDSKKRAGERRDAFRKKLRWIFPEYRYMCSVYPVLGKFPPLLPFCWLARDLRLIGRLFIGKGGSPQP